MSARPVTAPPGRPPATILASAVRSGVHADQLLQSARRHAETGDDFVENQQCTPCCGGPVAQLAQKPAPIGTLPVARAQRFDDDRGNVTRPRLSTAFHLDTCRRDRCATELAATAGGHADWRACRRNASDSRWSCRPASRDSGHGKRISLLLSGEGPRQTHRHLRRFGSGGMETHALGRRHQLADFFRPANVELVAGGKMRTFAPAVRAFGRDHHLRDGCDPASVRRDHRSNRCIRCRRCPTCAIRGRDWRRARAAACSAIRVPRRSAGSDSRHRSVRRICACARHRPIRWFPWRCWL